jgi:hypothetical protein
MPGINPFFKTLPNDDYNFRVNGWSTGGSTTSDLNGRRRTPQELLDYACQYPFPNETMERQGLRARLIALQKRYRDPNWQRHLCGPDEVGRD